MYGRPMEPIKTLGNLKAQGLNLKIHCPWCGFIVEMPIDKAIAAASKKRGGPRTHLRAFASKLKCKNCGFNDPDVKIDDGERKGAPNTMGVRL